MAHRGTQSRPRNGGTQVRSMFEVCNNTESLQSGKSRPQGCKSPRTDPYILFQTWCLLEFPFAMLGASPHPVTASATSYSLLDYKPQQQRWRYPTPPRARLQVHRQDPHSPSHQWLRRLRRSCSRTSYMFPSRPSRVKNVVLRALSALCARVARRLTENRVPVAGTRNRRNMNRPGQTRQTGGIFVPRVPGYPGTR